MKRDAAMAALTIVCALAHTALAQPAGTNADKSAAAPAVPAPLGEAAFQQELERLDAICARLNLVDERRLMANWLVSDRSDAHLLFMPVATDPLEAAGSAPTATSHASWLKHFAIARSRHAQHWFQTAQQQASAGDEWAAYRSLWRAAREDSAHSETKRVLGTLLTSLSIKGKPRPVPTVHPQFKWPAGSYWRMETTNFKITSRTDVAQTQRIASQLENFYALWTQAFYPLWAPPGIAAQRLSGGNRSWQRKQQVEVVLCKDRDDYLKTLGVAESNIGVSVGYYNPEAQLSFFYPDQSLDATLYHELTHQLLAEVSQLKGTAQAGEKSHFWLIEAVALYMESLVPGEHHWRLGGWCAPRMQGARYRAVHDGYWIEPAELDGLGLAALKERDDIARIYSHAAGLAHFFMDQRLPPVEAELSASDTGNGLAGRDASAQTAEDRLDSFDAEASRAAFFAALIAVYRGDSLPEQFWSIVGKENPQQDYLHFQLVRDRHIQSLRHAHMRVDSIEELVLSRSRLGTESWQVVGQFQQLTWLDLSNSNAKANDLRWLKQMARLERLSLEGVDIDRELLVNIGQLAKLKELDLSLCKLDDELLAPLKLCTQLETLWLSGTGVTEASLAWIEKLPKLKFVALDQTSVNPAVASQLNERLKKR